MRKIIHVDMDCFFAAVEMRDNPALRDIPIAIGGSRVQRGVISTANYPARKFGVRSAMPTAMALKLCPHLTLLPGRFDAYKEASLHIREIFSRYTSLIEPLSLDEAYLDVTDSVHCHGSATLMAKEIRQTIFNELNLTASAGVAPVKFLAKIASDLNKPNGQYVITPEEVPAFLKTLPSFNVNIPVFKISPLFKKGLFSEYLKTTLSLFLFLSFYTGYSHRFNNVTLEEEEQQQRWKNRKH